MFIILNLRIRTFILITFQKKKTIRKLKYKDQYKTMINLCQFYEESIVFVKD